MVDASTPALVDSHMLCAWSDKGTDNDGLMPAGKEAPITALPRAIPLLPVPGADASVAPPAQAPTGKDSRNAEAPAGKAGSLPGHFPSSPTHVLPNSPAVTTQASIDAVPGRKARHAGNARHRPGLLVHAPVMPSLPGLVPRPLTLAEAVAEAVTLAAYKAGSTDNLAALVVDLQPHWRSSSRLRKVPREPQRAGRGKRYGERDRAGPGLSGEGTDYSLPWHSTGLIVPQHGKGSGRLKCGPSDFRCKMA